MFSGSTAAWLENKRVNRKRSNELRERLSDARSFSSTQVSDGDGLRGRRLTSSLIPTHAAAAYVQTFTAGLQRAKDQRRTDAEPSRCQTTEGRADLAQPSRSRRFRAAPVKYAQSLAAASSRLIALDKKKKKKKEGTWISAKTSLAKQPGRTPTRGAPLENRKLSRRHRGGGGVAGPSKLRNSTTEEEEQRKTNEPLDSSVPFTRSPGVPAERVRVHS